MSRELLLKPLQRLAPGPPVAVGLGTRLQPLDRHHHGRLRPARRELDLDRRRQREPRVLPDEADRLAGARPLDRGLVAVGVAPVAALLDLRVVSRAEPAIERRGGREGAVAGLRLRLDALRRADRVALRLAVLLDGAARELVLVRDGRTPPRVDLELACEPVADLAPAELEPAAVVDQSVPLGERAAGSGLTGLVADGVLCLAFDFHRRLSLNARARG